MNTAYIALGANFGQPLMQLNKAIQLIIELESVRLISVASIYQSTAVGPGKQPDYLNSAVQITTSLNAKTLLANLHNIEDRLGRVREVHWGARTLDLDLLLYNDWVSTEKELSIPHPRMCERNFVIYPLFEIAPSLTLPNGQALKLVQQTLVNDGIQRKNDFNYQSMQWMS